MTEMTEYTPSSGAKFMGIILALIPIGVGIIFLYPVFFQNELASLMIAIPGFVLGAFILNYQLTKIIIDGDQLIFKPLFTKKRCHSLKNLKEIAWFILPQKHSNTLLGGTPQATGRAIGNGLLGLANKTTANSRQGAQLLLKELSGKHYYIKTNFINHSYQLVAYIEQVSGLQPITVLPSEYRAWRKGRLAEYRKNPDRIKRRIIQMFSPYLKARYLLFIPVMAFVLFTLALNGWFHWAEYKYFEIAKKPYAQDFIVEQPSPIKKNQYADEIDIYLKGDTQPALRNIIVEPRLCGPSSKRVENEFHYYSFPYESPDCFEHLINLDEDDEPEIIFRDDRGDYRYQSMVYDFDAANHQFVVKPIANYSSSLAWYIDTINLSAGPGWRYWFGMIIPILFAYLVIAGILLYAFKQAKKPLLKAK